LFEIKIEPPETPAFLCKFSLDQLVRLLENRYWATVSIGAVVVAIAPPRPLAELSPSSKERFREPLD
jgi:hypothetical protein